MAVTGSSPMQPCPTCSYPVTVSKPTCVDTHLWLIQAHKQPILKQIHHSLRLIPDEPIPEPLQQLRICLQRCRQKSLRAHRSGNAHGCIQRHECAGTIADGPDRALLFGCTSVSQGGQASKCPSGKPQILRKIILGLSTLL